MADARAALSVKLATARSAVAVDPMRRSKGEATGRSFGAHHSARHAQVMQLPSTSDGRGNCLGADAHHSAAVPPLTAHAGARYGALEAGAGSGAVPPLL